MFTALFNIIINLLATIIQIIVWPINEIIVSTMPDISEKLIFVANAFTSMFTGITWAVGLVPDFVVETLLFILTIEIAKHTIFISTHTLIKVWNVFQKIKFW